MDLRSRYFAAFFKLIFSPALYLTAMRGDFHIVVRNLLYLYILRFAKIAVISAIVLLSLLILAQQSAFSQVGIGFVNNGNYTGTIGVNKNEGNAYVCPAGSIARGYYHVDKSMSAPQGSTRGMTSQVGIYCTEIAVNSDRTISTKPLTPNGTPTVLGYGYPNPGTTQTDYCPSGEVVTQLGGYDRTTVTGYYWASSLRFICRPLQLGTSDWVQINTSTSDQHLAGINETNATHYFRGYFCNNATDQSVSGIYRQAGGEGYDGINIYCGTITQARHSAILTFTDFAWSEARGPDGWLVNLTQNGQLLQSSTGTSGANKVPYATAADNDPNVYQPASELYVLPGTGYGATVSQAPANIPSDSYVSSQTCVSTTDLANHQDSSCTLNVSGRLDIAVSMTVPTKTFNTFNPTMNITITATDMGPGDVSSTDGFALVVDIPTGWTPSAVPGCTVSGQTLTCQINTDLAPAPQPGSAGGSVSFTFPVTVNSSVQDGTQPVNLHLDRSIPDASGDPTAFDYNTANDTTSGPISYSTTPALTITKVSKDNVGTFTFTGNNGWQQQSITTTQPNTETRGSTQPLQNTNVDTTITEALPANWVLDNVSCTGLGSSGSYTYDTSTASFTISAASITDQSDIYCTVTNQYVNVETSKTSNFGNNTAVQANDPITYTLTTVVTGESLSQDLVITDTLNSSLTFGSVTAPGSFTADTSGVPVLKFTLPAGTAPGTYTVSYTATINEGATSPAENTATTNIGNCNDCTVTHPIVMIDTEKTSNIPDGTGVQPGDTIVFTTTVTVTGGPTTKDILLIDTSSSNIDFGAVLDTGDFIADISQIPVLRLTLPAGTPAGTHSVTYNGTVKANATGFVTNEVAPDAGTCGTCSTSHPVITVNVSKDVDAGNNNSVQPGDTLTYTLTTVIGLDALTHDLILTDTLGSNLTFDAISANPGNYTTDTSGNPNLTFTLPAGTAPGTYTVSYTATVNNGATGVANNELAINGGTCNNCETNNPIVNISTAKSSNVGNGTAVQNGDTITYTLTTIVSGGPTPKDVVLTDTLGSGLTFGSVTSAGNFTADTSQAPTLKYTLPAGTAAGTYTVSYTATVNQDATGSVGNAVTADSGSCTDCSTQNPAVSIRTAKTSNPGNGAGAERGDTVTYTLTTTVTGGATTENVVLTDTMGSGLTFDSVTAPGSFTADTSQAPTLKFTLPAGTAAGTYTVSYTATVNQNATTSVSNLVTPSSGVCTSCSTTIPIVDIVTAKSSNVDNSNGAERGDTITYTLTTTVSGGTTTADVVLTDTLGSGLTFGSVTAPGSFTSDTSQAPTLKFTLPAGTAPGTYTVSYTATVNQNASDTVSNLVIPNSGVCTNCATTTPIIGVVTAKSSNVGNGTAVETGDTITYTLTTTITGGAMPRELTLTDTLGSGLTFGSVTAPGDFTADTSQAPTLKFTLPAGTAAGTYTVSYTATVNQNATGSVGNAVTADNGTCTDCATQNPTVSISTSKSSDPGNGAGAQKGDTITYTLTTTITGDATPRDIVLTDTLGSGLTFGSVTAPGSFTADTSQAPTLKFTLPAGTAAGTYTVSYTATVNQNATGSVGNSVTANNGTCTNCSTTTPIIDIVTAKSSNPASGSATENGDTITYTLTTTVTGGATPRELVLTDTLGNGLTFGSVTAPGSFTADTSQAPVLKFTLDAGTAAGTYTISYTATVNDDAKGSVGNSVTASTGTCANCSTTTPIVDIVTAKSSNIGNGTPVRAGDTITYTLTTTVTGGATTKNLVLTDTLSDTLNFGSVTAPGSFTADTSQAPTLKFTLPTGKAPGTYTVSYTAIVGAEATGSVNNAVAADNGSCAACDTENPITDSVSIAKDLVSESGSFPGLAEPGEILTYEITLTNNGGVASDYAVVDILDANTIFVSADNGGIHNGSAAGGTVDWTGLTVPSRSGSTAGVLKLTVAVKVVDPLPPNVTQLSNIAKKNGSPDPACPSAQCAISDIIVVQNKISLTQTAVYQDVDNSGTATPGDQVLYTFTVTNDGNTTINNLQIEDGNPTFNGHPATGTLSPTTPTSVATLAPHESATFTAVYTLTQTDIDNGGPGAFNIDNLATALGYELSGTTIQSNETTTTVVPPVRGGDISITKTADLPSIRRGEQAPFTIRVTNNSKSRETGIRVVDTMPSGFRFVEGSASIGGVAVTPIVNGRSVIFENVSVEGSSSTDIHLRMLALSSAGPGEHTNKATAYDSTGKPITGEAKAKIEIMIEPVFDCGDVIGRVFDDSNRNSYPDKGEKGLPGVRLATARGWLITTDKNGRFNIPCAALPDQRIGSNFILKLDTRTLPTGYRLTTENPLVVRLTAGKMSKLNFGATIGRVVRLDLKGDAFETGGVILKQRWQHGISQLINVLMQEQSTLRLSYIDTSSSAKLADQRMAWVRKQITEQWRQHKGTYQLEIETRVEAGK